MEHIKLNSLAHSSDFWNLKEEDCFDYGIFGALSEDSTMNPPTLLLYVFLWWGDTKQIVCERALKFASGLKILHYVLHYTYTSLLLPYILGGTLELLLFGVWGEILLVVTYAQVVGGDTVSKDPHQHRQKYLSWFLINTALLYFKLNV